MYRALIRDTQTRRLIPTKIAATEERAKEIATETIDVLNFSRHVKKDEIRFLYESMEIVAVINKNPHKKPSNNASIKLDADAIGEWLVFLADYHSWITDQLNLGLITGEEAADSCYMLGNLEGRLKYNHLDQKDYEMMVSMRYDYDKCNEWPNM